MDEIKTGKLLDALKHIRQIARDSINEWEKQSLSVPVGLLTTDRIARDAMHEFFRHIAPQQNIEKHICMCGKEMKLTSKKIKTDLILRSFECASCGWNTTTWELKDAEENIE